MEITITLEKYLDHIFVKLMKSFRGYWLIMYIPQTYIS